MPRLAPASPSDLSPEEVRVVVLVAEGWTDQRIARELGVSVSTVRRRIRTASRALGAESRVRLAVLAERCGLVEDRDG